MKTVLILAITFFAITSWGQDYLDVTCTKDGKELSLKIENHNISGPTRIKFNTEIHSLTAVDVKGGLLREKDGQFVLIWMAIPKDEVFTLKFETEDVADDILTIYYLVEGDRVIKDVKMSDNELAIVEDSTPNETENATTENENSGEDVVAEETDLTEADLDETMEVEETLEEDEAIQAEESEVVEEELEEEISEDETMPEEKREDTTTNGVQEEIAIEDEDPKSYKVPLIYRPLDINKNDEISADEINNAIDLFFDGEVDLSADDLNGLIDFFFEQE